MKKKKLNADPICISVENISDKEQVASLFSLIKKDENENVIIKTLDDNIDYEFLKLMLLKESYLIGKTRFHLSDTSCLEDTMHLNIKDVFSRVYSIPFPLMKMFDLWQMQESLLEFKKPFNLEAGVSLPINLQPKQKMQIILFPFVKYYGAQTDLIGYIKNNLTEKYESENKKFVLLESIKTKNITTPHYFDVAVKAEENAVQEIKEYTIQPEWEMRITHIRTIGFYPANITVGDRVISPITFDFEGEDAAIGIPVFSVNNSEPHTPMKIKIPDGINGYILFYREEKGAEISYNDDLKK